MTETTICSTVHRLGAEDFESSQPIPIGRPMTGHRLYVLDADLQPRPVGAPGELYIAGEGVARGYQKNAVFEDRRSRGAMRRERMRQRRGY